MPTDDDKLLFDQLGFQVIQGGLSWVMVLEKREGLRRAFADFDFERSSHNSTKPTSLASSRTAG